MGFLRRLLGGGQGGDEPAPASRTAHAGREDVADAAEPGGGSAPPDEAARERELLRADADRLNDPLLQRQLRYADRSWTPPRQGGDRRADDDTSGGED